MARKSYGPWMQTFTGKAFYPLDPLIDDIDIVDIGHALAMQCRYAGHTRSFYSVAEHSVLVARCCPREHALAGLLHDASEAYLVDLPSPVKISLPDYAAIEAALYGVIAERFGLPPAIPRIVKEIDRRILLNERDQLMALPPLDWNVAGPELPGLTIMSWTPQEAEERFLFHFRELGGSYANHPQETPA